MDYSRKGGKPGFTVKNKDGSTSFISLDELERQGKKDQFLRDLEKNTGKTFRQWEDSWLKRRGEAQLKRDQESLKKPQTKPRPPGELETPETRRRDREKMDQETGPLFPRRSTTPEPVQPSDSVVPDRAPAPRVRPSKTNKDGSDVTRVGPNKSGLTPMQQWAKNFPKLAAKVKPGQSGYAEINPTTTSQSTNVKKSTPIRLLVQPANPGKVSTGGYDPRRGSYAQQLNTTLTNLGTDYGRVPQSGKYKTFIKPVSQRTMQTNAYDLVLDYLLSEGHVDTVEEAHYVMLQMTSEHVRDIVEGAGYSNPSIGGKPILNPKGHPQEGKPASFNKAETEGVDRYKRARKETGKKLPVDGPLPPGY